LRQIAISSSNTGLRAQGRFQLALDCNTASSIHLEIEPDKPLILRYANQERVLGAGLQRVIFGFECDRDDGMIAVQASDPGGRPCTVAVRRASAEG
jgi:hypothetical protein